MNKLRTAIALVSALSIISCAVSCKSNAESKESKASNESSDLVEPAGEVNSEAETEPEVEIDTSVTFDADPTKGTEDTTSAEFTLDAESQRLLEESRKLSEQMEKSLQDRNGNSSNTDEKTVETTTSNSEAYKRIGENPYGYIDIPSDWVRFKDDTATGNLLQYSDITGKTVITLSYYDVDSLDAYQAAQNFSAGLFESPDIDEDSITGATVTLGVDKVKSYQVYCFYPKDGTFLVAYLFDGSDGYVHYLAIEGNDMNIFNLADTYKLTDK